jgi:hypothetical protein
VDDYKTKLPEIEERVIAILGRALPPMPKSPFRVVGWMAELKAVFIENLTKTLDDLPEEDRVALRLFTAVEGEEAFAEWGKKVSAKLLKKTAMEAYPGAIGQAFCEAVDEAYPD